MRLSTKNRKGLYAKLNVNSVTSLATGGVHHAKAKASSAYPLVIFQRASNILILAFGITVKAEDEIYLIKAVSDHDSSGNKSPEEKNDDILEACEAAIGSSLTLEGGAVTKAVYRLSDIPDYQEDLTDRTLYYSGFLLRVVSASE